MLFGESREYSRAQKLKKQASNTVKDKRIENTIRLELREILQKYLLANDKVTIEIAAQNVSVFLGILSEPEFSDWYTYSQESDVLYSLMAKEVAWN